MRSGLMYKSRKPILLLCISVLYFSLVSITSAKSSNGTGEEVLWLEFSPTPKYNIERSEIQESDAKRIKDDYERYKEERKRFESKYREQYEKMYKSSSEFLKRNPYKYPDYKQPIINYDFIALADVNENGQKNNAFVVAGIIKEGKFTGQATINWYKKEQNGHWKFISSINTYNDIGIERTSKKLIISGCQKNGMFVSPKGIGQVIDLQKEAHERKEDSKKINSIVNKEFGAIIRREKEKYKKKTNMDYQEELRIAGIFQDLNGDGKLDIVITLNDSKYMYMYPDGKKMPTGSRFQLFCFGDKGCEHYIMMNKGDNSFEITPLGYANCIGMSRPNEKGFRDIYMEHSTAVWDGSAFRAAPYKPNWMERE